MSVMQIAQCDTCRKWMPFNQAEKEFFMVNVSHVYCSEECWSTTIKSKGREL